MASACSDDATSPGVSGDVGADTPTSDIAADVGSDAADTAVEPATFSDGTWPVRMSFQDFGGVEARFEWTFTGVTPEGIDRVEFQGVAVDGTRSGVLVAVEDVVITDGTFTMEFEPFFLPGAYSPTSSDLDLDAIVVAQVVAGDFICGDVSGQISTFDVAFT
ncbi:MAG: hypothetical protein ACJAYU_002853, partial [Bradymonadia bacterium]